MEANNSSLTKDKLITNNMFMILVWLWKAETLTEESGLLPTEISNLTGIRLNTVSAALKRLSDLGYVIKEKKDTADDQ